ncbi:hypothetical protein ANCCAN_21710 [Ancylostoma caninum]|uniref:Uncharacterized protein n=1 Tax=Ancylostoma caninum TaxID=29170 RepID=A0A368FN66_ANCCA|nr:hypothetical protein ANCCAN_21710 [Ancylostoma caninum]
MSSRSEHVWANDRLYLTNQPIFESVMYAFTTMYLIGLYYIYATYKPKDMHKLVGAANFESFEGMLVVCFSHKCPDQETIMVEAAD